MNYDYTHTHTHTPTVIVIILNYINAEHPAERFEQARVLS